MAENRNSVLGDLLRGEMFTRFLSAALQWLSPAFAAAAGWLAAMTDGYSISVALVLAAIAFGATALGIERSRALWRARSVKDRLAQQGLLFVRAAEPATKDTGYTLSVMFQNTCDVPLAFSVHTFDLKVNDRASREGKMPSSPTLVVPGIPAIYRSGLIPLGEPADTDLQGTFRMKFKYGRPGNLKHFGELNIVIVGRTNAIGDPVIIDFHTERP